MAMNRQSIERTNQLQRGENIGAVNLEAVRRISQEATTQWRKALTGLTAVPAAIALGWASAAMYLALFLEEGFQAFVRTSERISEDTNRTGDQAWRPSEQQRTNEEQPRA